VQLKYKHGFRPQLTTCLSKGLGHFCTWIGDPLHWPLFRARGKLRKALFRHIDWSSLLLFELAEVFGRLAMPMLREYLNSISFSRAARYRDV